MHRILDPVRQLAPEGSCEPTSVNTVVSAFPEKRPKLDRRLSTHCRQHDRLPNVCFREFAQHDRTAWLGAMRTRVRPTEVCGSQLNPRAERMLNPDQDTDRSCRLVSR